MFQKFSKLPRESFVPAFGWLRKYLGKGYEGRIGMQVSRLKSIYDLFCKRAELGMGFDIVDDGSCVNEDTVNGEKLFRKSHTLSSLNRFTYFWASPPFQSP